MVVGQHVNDKHLHILVARSHSFGACGSCAHALEYHVAWQELRYHSFPTVGWHASGAAQGDGHRAVVG